MSTSVFRGDYPPAFKIRENSTYEHLSFSGGLPMLGVYPNSFQVYVLIARLNKPIDQLAHKFMFLHIFNYHCFQIFPFKIP